MFFVQGNQEKSRIDFFYTCEKKGGAFLNDDRRLPDNSSYKFAVNDEDGQQESIPGAVIDKLSQIRRAELEF